MGANLWINLKGTSNLNTATSHGEIWNIVTRVGAEVNTYALKGVFGTYDADLNN
jgi:hypothetical protein